MSNLGVVIIGRNEGERLRACLSSLMKDTETRGHGDAAMPVIYVDSGSTDGSVDLARSLGVEVVDLDMSRPFSAARARNEGFGRLRELASDVEYVQFVDGDCMVHEGWLQAAAGFLQKHPEYAAVAGRLRERYPEASVYNRLCDVEWNTPVGDIDACGGVAMYRVSCFRGVGGFDASLVAGEEPELCLRLRQAGWKIRRLDAEMALHDAAMTRFGQWWKRAVRGGYGGTDVSLRFEKGTGAFSRQIRSARFWGIGWPLAASLATVAACGLGGWMAAIVTAALCLLILPLQMVRISIRRYRRYSDVRTAVAYGIVMMVGKWAHLQGQYRYWRDCRAGRHLSLIEYKAPAPRSEVVRV